MAFTKKNDEAVSPVIGVILMVAVTVILAAVIAAFVFGMAGNLQKGKVVAFSAARSGTTVTITNMGGQDVGTLDSLSSTVDGAVTSVTGGKTVGSEGEITVPTDAVHHIVVIGTFTDGAKQILLDTNL